MKTLFKTSLTILSVSLILFMPLVGNSTAEPYILNGYLKDSESLPIPNANIQISGTVYNQLINGYETRYYNTTTNAQGYFIIGLAVDDPDSFSTGDKVTVHYNLGNIEGTREFTLEMPVGRDAWFNITHANKMDIGEILLSPIGIVSIIVLASIAFVAIYLYHNSRHDTASKDEKSPNRVERRRRQR